MADSSKITEQQVAELTSALRGEASVDIKVKLVTAVKSGIKQHNVPETVVAQLAEALRMASSSAHGNLANAGFTGLGHLLTRLSRQEPRILAKEAVRCLPLVVEKLGDAKDKFRGLAANALTTLHRVAAGEVERAVKTSALAGKNPRAKDMAMHWLVQMHDDEGMQFRAYVPALMELLEDADGAIRETAKNTVMHLFKNAPSAAKSDLKRQLKSHKVRPAIEQAIVKSLSSGARPDTPSESASVVEHRRVPIMAASVSSSVASERPITPMPDSSPTEPVEPLLLDTHRDLDDVFRDMAWAFEGRETEQNWMKREQSMTTLRRVTAGNAPSDMHDALVSHLRSMLDGIIKAATSLRTSLSKEACSLVQDLAVALGPGLDPLVELLMQTFLKLSGGTKKISSQQANVTVDTILGRVTYTPRLMQHVWAACQDKNVQPRTYASGWIKTILSRQAHHKSHVEHTGGAELMEKCIKKGLSDANPAVREKMRSTYWAFWGVWPARANGLMASLDPTAQKLLAKDPSNPNADHEPADAAAAARPGLGLSKSTMSVSSKPSLREAMLAQKKALAAARNELPARPGSAMAHISPPRVVSSSSSTGLGVKHRPRGEVGAASVTAGGGAAMAAARAARRRPELVARPATAGPYSMRRDESDVPSPEVVAHRRTREASLPRYEKAASPRPRGGALSRQASSPRPAARQALSPRPTTRQASSPRPTARPASSPRPATRPASSPRPATRQASSPRPTARQASSPRPATRDASSPRPATQISPRPRATSSPRQYRDLSSRQPIPRPRPGHTLSQLHHPAAAASPSSKIPSPRGNASTPRFALSASLPVSSPVPSLDDAAALMPAAPIVSAEAAATPALDDATTTSATPARTTLQVYQDPDDAVATSPPPPARTPAVLEDKPVNQDAGKLASSSPSSKSHQTCRLIDSGISKIKTRTLDVHGFRKLQSLLRDSARSSQPVDDAVLASALFEYIQDAHLPADGALDLATQALSTLNLVVASRSPALQALIPSGLDALIRTRARYDARAHIVSGLELLAAHLVASLDNTPSPAVVDALAPRLEGYCRDAAPAACRSLSMGLHVLAQLVGRRKSRRHGDDDDKSALDGDNDDDEAMLDRVARLAQRALASADSGVRMDAVKLCVALHARAGDAAFWAAMHAVDDDSKSLITYYVVKRQRQVAA